MLRREKVSLTLILFLSAFVADSSAVDDEKIFTAEDFVQNRVPRCSPKNERTSLLVRINARLSPYRFTLIPEPVATTDGNVHHVGRIEISRSRSHAILQTIEVNSNWSDSVCRLFDAKDVNFDGYLDISVVREGAGTWASRDYYLFDPPSGRFITSDLTHDLDQVKENGLELDWKRHEIQASFMLSLCGGMDMYRIEKGRLLKVQDDIISVDTRSDQCEETVRRQVNGKWKVLGVKTTKLPQ